jgi:hypothetical protein
MIKTFCSLGVVLLLSNMAESQDNIAFQNGYPTPESAAALKDELLYQRATQSYLWAMPLLNIWAMKEASEAKFGKGYNVLPIWKKRLNAKTVVTTPNSDVIYAMGYLDLKDGPIVIEAPPGLQGILDDFFQRPICSEFKIGERRWCGDVGLPGPDKGKGGKYLLLPPDFKEKVQPGYFTYRSKTYGVFVFWRGFFKDPKELQEPVRVMEETRIYPLGQEADAKPMKFPDASGVPINMLMPRDAGAFDMLKRAIDSEYPDPADRDMRGMLANIGIVKGESFKPDAHTREILDKAARRASEMGRYAAYEAVSAMPGGLYYPDRRYVNGFPPIPGTPDFTTPTYTDVQLRSGFFSLAYSASPVMAVNVVDVGAKYPTAFRDADADYLVGDRAYKLHLPPKIPAKLFWSVTLYDAESASGLDNGQPFPSINTMDKPAANPDGSIDLYFGPASPGEGKNYLATVPGRGFFVMIRLYGPGKTFFNKTWKPGDVEKLR